MPISHLSPALYEKACPKGIGTFCREPVGKGEVLAVFGGSITTQEGLASFSEEDRQNCVQITRHHYIVPSPAGPGDHFNHSCDPNAGILGQIVLVAIRDIAVGEEVCFDYAMTDTSNYDEFDCLCGESNCRGKVTGNDWKLPELRERYRGFFSSYVEELQIKL